MSRRAPTAAWLAALALGALAAPAAAAPTYLASTSGPGAVSSPSPVSIAYADERALAGGGSWSQTGSAFASTGVVGTSTRVAASVPAPLAPEEVPTGFQTSLARFAVDDLVLSDASGAATRVSTALRLALDGELVAAVADARTTDPETQVFSVVRVGATLFGASYFADVRGQVEQRDPFGGPPVQTADGVLASWPLALVSIPFADVPVGVPLGLALYLYSEASLQHGSGAEPIALEAEAYAAFEHTLSFDPLGPVFELPEGFGADAPSAGIAGNRFVVPEPAPLALVAFGLVALSATGKRGGSVR